MCPVQMPSLMLIFAKKQKITFFDPLGWWVGRKKNSFTMIEFLLPVTGPPFPGLCASKPVFCRDRFLGFYLNCLAHFLSSVPVAFFPANKKYFICRNEIWLYKNCHLVLKIIVFIFRCRFTCFSFRNRKYVLFLY